MPLALVVLRVAFRVVLLAGDRILVALVGDRILVALAGADKVVVPAH